jgi:endonuclease/exonuclease/phosphatase family metal-dependent hydrolase
MHRFAPLFTAIALGSLAMPSGAAELKLAIFNIWYGGVQVDSSAVAEAIRAADADIVALQEPEGMLRTYAQQAGYSFVDERLHLMSHFPIFPGRAGDLEFGYVAVDPAHVVAVAGLHLTSSPYGPELVRDGESLEAVVANEAETRVPEIEPYAENLSAVAGSGVPTFVMGDFNTPSHLDWTPAVVASGRVKLAVNWPVTEVLADAGFADSYRTVHPDPVANPGLTWTAGTPPPLVRKIETLDRIDMIWSSGPAEAIASEIVGELGGADVGIGLTVWPADHRGLVSTFEVTPAAAPLLVGVDQPVIRQGELLTARYLMPFTDAGRKVAIVGATDDTILQSLPVYDGSDHRAVRFGTQTLPPGAYRAALIDADGKIEASAPFWLLGRDALPTVTVTGSGPFDIGWTNGPANRLDWIGIYAAGEPDLYNYFGFVYTGATSTGLLGLDPTDYALVPGRYEARLMLDDGYSILASAEFEVGQ